jgi:hypothetical protein
MAANKAHRSQESLAPNVLGKIECVRIALPHRAAIAQSGASLRAILPDVKPSPNTDDPEGACPADLMHEDTM